MRIILVFCLLLPFFLQAQVPLTAGMKIHSSLVAEKKSYELSGAMDLSTPLIEISGNDVVIDFNGAILKGNNKNELPNQYQGLAILIHDAKNVTIKNLTARGYKVAVMARNVESLTIEHCNLSYNYRQHLNSTQEKEDISDWMSYHHNEKDEWLRYGAALYLRNCNKSRIHDNIVTGGQCALMMTDCNNGMIYKNNFSFNSGIGIGLYRSNNNIIFYNKLDFNVRGYSNLVYNRGQDSAGILVFEQCNNNVVYKNSVTHSGDGFFLWAGQTTMDTGEGGCNNNVVFENDFSYAPTNGVEVTFSTNTIYGNSIVECDNGVWAGYSYQTQITNNKFANNRTAIAIEHGQQNKIALNQFSKDSVGISLWARNSQPSDWGYAKKKNTESKNYSISSNQFDSVGVVYRIKKTDSVKLAGNGYKHCSIIYKLDNDVSRIDSSESTNGYKNLGGTIDLNLSHLLNMNQPTDLWLDESFAGKKQIHITEWGPYDFRYPLIWRTNPADSSGILKFDIIGPDGKWKLIAVKGITGVSKSSGSFPASITASRVKGSKNEVLLELEYTGKAITDQFGSTHAANRPYRFTFRDGRVPIQWNVSWYAFDSLLNPVKNSSDWEKILSQPSVLQQQSPSLDYAWWGGINIGGKRYERFVTVATAALDVSPGKYELSTTWDDAVRVYLDNKMILDEWNPSQYTFDESPNKTIQVQLSGRHSLRLEHVELGGFATINLKLKKL